MEKKFAEIINEGKKNGKKLSEINADIIRILLEQNDGNQSQTAKSLGISRTTMWRMLKEQNGQKGKQ